MLLRPRHYKAIELLATTDMTQKAIAKELGAATRTLRKWMKDEEFLSELARRREADPQSFRTLRLSAARNRWVASPWPRCSGATPSQPNPAAGIRTGPKCIVRCVTWTWATICRFCRNSSRSKGS